MHIYIMYNFMLTNRQQIFVIIMFYIVRHSRRTFLIIGRVCKDKTTPVKGFSFVPPLTGVVQSLHGREKKKTIFCFFLPIINKLKKELHKSSSNLLNTLLCDNQYFATSPQVTSRQYPISRRKANNGFAVFVP